MQHASRFAQTGMRIGMEEFTGRVRHRHVELAQKILDFAIERGLHDDHA